MKVSEVIKVYDNAGFVIVGDAKLGSEKFKEDMVNLSVNLNLKDRLIFSGFREDLPQALAAFDILVVPSRAEPFGRVIIEAFACGIPVIAVNAGATAEIIPKEFNMLVQLDNIEELTQKIIKLLEDIPRAKFIGREGRKLVLERFSIDKHGTVAKRVSPHEFTRIPHESPRIIQ